MDLLKIILLGCILVPGLPAAQQRFTVPFTADSGSIPLSPSKPQMVEQSIVFDFPPDFPVNQQDCLNGMYFGFGPCHEVSAATEVAYTYKQPAVGPGQTADFSGRTDTPLAMHSAGFQFRHSYSCSPDGQCSMSSTANPVQAPQLLLVSPPYIAKFGFSAVLVGPGRASTKIDFGTAHLRGVLVVNVTFTAPNQCGKLDKMYTVPALSQYGSGWSSSCYDGYSGDCANTLAPPPNDRHGKHETIGDWGCDLTALAALLTNAGLPETPLSLNAFMGAHGLFDGLNVEISGTVGALRHLKSHLLRYSPLNDYRRTVPSTPSEIADALDNGPVLAAVRTSAGPQGHFLVITGRTCQPDGTYQFTAMNPGSSNPSSSAKLSEKAVIVRGYLQDPPDLGEIDIAGDDPVNLLLTSPSGQRIGYDPVSKVIIGDIPVPDATYDRDVVVDPDTDEPISGVTTFLTVNNPTSGSFLVRITGLKAGLYVIKVHTFSRDGTDQGFHDFTGTATPGSSATYRINYSPDNNPETTTTPILGDTNGDGIVDCSDVAIVKAALGKRTGEADFAANADVNGDGVVDVRDLAFVSQHLPAGTRCQ